MAKQNSRPVRVIAAMVVMQVSVNGQSLGKALANGQQQLARPAEGALLQEMCYGTLRWYFQLDAIVAGLLKKPLKERDQDIFCLMLVGLYQLQYMNIPAHAVIQETVNALLSLKKAWAKGLVNAILREYQRSADEIRAGWQDDLEAEMAHPQWMIDRLCADWPDQYADILQANNQRPPMILRVNRQCSTVGEYLSALSDKGMKAAAHPVSPDAIVLEHAVGVMDLPGFARGVVSVQDASAQLAAPLLELEPGQRVLDACAAPGGKTSHLLELMPECEELVALDIDDQRLSQVRENLERIGLQATLLAGDAASPDDWWDGRSFDRILLDVPCSGTGVIRRHPDIKLLRTPEDIENLVVRQVDILDAVWPLLAPGGMLVYTTCSVFKQENELQAASFIGRHVDAEEVGIEATWGAACLAGRQILPGREDMDGFFFARLKKIE